MWGQSSGVCRLKTLTHYVISPRSFDIVPKLVEINNYDDIENTCI